jgi:hypothetical protein
MSSTGRVNVGAYPGLYYGVLQVPPSTRQTLDLKLAMF